MAIRLKAVLLDRSHCRYFLRFVALAGHTFSFHLSEYNMETWKHFERGVKRLCVGDISLALLLSSHIPYTQRDFI